MSHDGGMSSRAILGLIGSNLQIKEGSGRAEGHSGQRGRGVSNSIGTGTFGDEGQLVAQCDWSRGCAEGRKR